MSLPGRFDPRVRRKMYGGLVSAALHVVLFLVILAGGRPDGLDRGDSPTSQLVFLKSSDADRRDGEELRLLEPTSTTPAPPNEEQLQNVVVKQVQVPVLPEVVIEQTELITSTEPPLETVEPVLPTIAPIPSTFHMSEAEKAAVSQRLEQLAEQALNAPRAEVAWEENGRKYSATLIRELARDGTALERVVAQVSSADRGRQLKTLVNLKRLAFSQFTQIVDRWDPLVQLHDDEIDGRFHSNSQFNLMYDSHTAPKFLGKVTTSARNFNAESNARRKQSDIFQGGVETQTSRIDLPESLQPFEWAPRDENARIHEFTTDSYIRFFADGSYTWRARDASKWEYLNQPTEQPIYFLAARDAALYIKGVVSGKILVYSPQRIVIEGSLTYAHDPRTTLGSSGDYLGLVCDRYIDIASPGVTGSGDLEIDAAIFARRRFNVTNIDHPRTATLRIYGSLAAGTLSATEPRYATKIDYDRRFERQRPPGFPSTNRYEAADWDGQWTELPERAADN